MSAWHQLVITERREPNPEDMRQDHPPARSRVLRTIECPQCQAVNSRFSMDSGPEVWCCEACHAGIGPHPSPIFPERTITLLDCGHTFQLTDDGKVLVP